MSDLINNGSIELTKSKNKIGNSSKPEPLVVNDSHSAEVMNQYNMPQWPRVQLDKQTTSNLIINNKLVTSNSSSSECDSRKLANNRKNEKLSNPSQAQPIVDSNSEHIEFDGDETVNCYGKATSTIQRSKAEANSTNVYDASSLNNTNNNGSGQNNNVHTNSVGTSTGSTLNPSDNAKDGNNNVYDLTMKLRYLEKSIKFIQQQHNETLSCLHQEIEKLKNENRELHFKLATRKGSESSLGRTLLRQNSQTVLEKLPQQQKIVTRITSLNINEKQQRLEDPHSAKGFEKALNQSVNEGDFDNRLEKIKNNYDQNRYDELLTRLTDAESKNEYLSKIIGRLQSNKQNRVNSSYKMNSSSFHNFSENTKQIDSRNVPSPSLNQHVTNSNLAKINLNNIYTIEPLRIKLNENDEPRPPTNEESEVFISKLYNLYKHQKQQISNMKVVLKDMMHTENLSNQGMMMTKDVLENNATSSKFGQASAYLIDNTSGFGKLSIVTPITRFAPQSGMSNRRYHSQFLATLDSANTSFHPIEVAASLSSANAVSNIHLPPLQTINPAKFPDRQRRTQVLQKQRLRRDYFH